jgi:hypothetical protein
MASKTKKTAAKKGKQSRKKSEREPKPVEMAEVSGGRSGGLIDLLHNLSLGKGNANGK